MAIIDIENMYAEMRSTMECNFDGNAEERFEQAKKQFLDSVAEAIEQNHSDLVEELKHYDDN